MINLKLYPYVMGSQSAKDLAQLLDIKRLSPDSDSYVPKYGQVVIGWGQGKIPVWHNKAQARQVKFLNTPAAVNTASNKLTALQALKNSGIHTPDFTTNFYIAQQWLDQGATVVERHELRGNSGDGIRIVNNSDPEMPSTLTNAPLYTKFIPKTAEFRVHVFRGKVIDYIEKKRLPTDRRPTNFNKYVSSINLGWVFSRTDIRDIPEVRQIAIKSVSALGLDFGAVDIVFYDGLPFVLEVNSAPGLGGTTLVNYANAFRQFMGAADLPTSVTSSIMDQVVPTRPVAAHVAQVDTARIHSTPVDEDMVTLRIDRSTARKLRSLLAAVC